MKSLKISLIILCLTAITLPATAGEWGHERDGFVIGFNAGGGSATVKPNTGNEDSGGGGAGSFRLAWAFANQFMVGYESTAWVGNTDLDGELTLSTHKINFTWYPGGTGWFARAGFGGGNSELTGRILNVDVSVQDSGGAYGLGGGYEWRLTRKFALGAAIDWNTVSLDYGDFSFVNYTAQFNWYF